jgi:hypothetical protein
MLRMQEALPALRLRLASSSLKILWRFHETRPDLFGPASAVVGEGKGLIGAAEKLAQVQTDRAKDIMSRQASTDDELQRSREALKLIQEMVGQ